MRESLIKHGSHATSRFAKFDHDLEMDFEEIGKRWAKPISSQHFIINQIQIPAFFLINASPSRASCMESGKMSRQIFVAAAMFGRADPKASMVR